MALQHTLSAIPHLRVILMGLPHIQFDSTLTGDPDGPATTPSARSSPPVTACPCASCGRLQTPRVTAVTSGRTYGHGAWGMGGVCARCAGKHHVRTRAEEVLNSWLKFMPSGKLSHARQAGFTQRQVRRPDAVSEWGGCLCSQSGAPLLPPIRPPHPPTHPTPSRTLAPPSHSPYTSKPAARSQRLP